ncbi:MAG: hypothetical protein JEZ04_01595 [Spirochaetales bacterium]|nr:hypothetical protein [Spirochaetales bacterium]
MSDKQSNFFKKTMSLLTIGYNKGIILSKVTQSAMNIIERKIQNIHNSLETIVASFEEIRATSESTSTNTENIYSSMSEIIQTTSSVNSAIQKNVEEITHATEESQKLHGLFSSLEDKSSQVREMTREIDDVAQQTNILAINASIEAARAGSSGKGFNIIAKEIRSLSVQTQDFANTISGSINEFNSGLKQVRGSFNDLIVLLENFQKDMLETSRDFDKSRKSLENSGYMLAEIKGGVSEQTIAITDGLKSLEDVFRLLQDANSISSTLNRTHDSLDQLLNKEN